MELTRSAPVLRPDGQALQSPASSLPATVTYLPNAQSMQSASASLPVVCTYFPTVQFRHCVPPVMLRNCPAAQFKQTPAKPYLPLGQVPQNVVESLAHWLCVFPSSQFVHSVLPAASAYFPLGHASHKLLEASEILPAGHALTHAAAPRSRCDHLVPGSHKPSDGPTPHDIMNPGSEYCPAAHAMHCDASVLPVESIYVPAEHSLQYGSPVASAYRPGGQSMHAEVLPLTLVYLPVLHAMQSFSAVALVAALYFPAAQSVQPVCEEVHTITYRAQLLWNRQLASTSWVVQRRAPIA